MRRALAYNRWFTTAIAIAASTAVAACGPAEVATPGMPAPDARQVAQGQAIHAQQCASCHGARGEGAPRWNNPDAAGELPPPPHDSTGHTWRHADGMLFRIVRDGWRDPYNASDRLTMPPFATTLTPGETRAVIAYLKTWWTPEQRDFQWRESRKEPFPDSVPPSTTPPAAG